jgi:hypothetical protein
MISFSVIIDQPGLKREIAKGVRPIVREFAFAVEAQMKLLMTQPKSGRQYKRGSRTHTASRPGEAPAVDTGFLINSIRTAIISDTRAEIVVGAEYAEALEFGGDKVAERPFIRPAIEGVIGQFGKGGILAGLRK